MERVVLQDPQAIEMLYDRYSRLVYSLVLRILREPATAEELVQEVFLHLWRNARAYQPERGALEPWLVTMARNRALDALRSKAAKQRRVEQDSEEFMLDQLNLRIQAGSPAASAEELIDQNSRALLVRQHMQSLPAAQRRAIEMAYFQGMTQSEIAEALHEPLGTVKTWIRAALTRLREGLAEVGHAM